MNTQTEAMKPAQHEMTPEMMRKVQMHSELGAYAASNLVGAYDLFQEFWRVAMSAAPQPAQPERHELQAKGEHPAPCARHCEATAFRIVIRNLKAQLAQPAVQQEPVAGKGKELSKQLKLCAGNVAFAAGGCVDIGSAAMQEMFALIDHVCVGLDSPPAQQEPLFKPLIDLHPGLAEELKAMETSPQPAQRTWQDLPDGKGGMESDLNVLRAVSDEYNAWIRHHAACHSYDDFLEKRKAVNGFKEKP
jgi:hypothetical protein